LNCMMMMLSASMLSSHCTAWRLMPAAGRASRHGASRNACRGADCQLAFTNRTEDCDRGVNVEAAEETGMLDDDDDFWGMDDCFDVDCWLEVEVKVAPLPSRSFDTPGYEAPAHMRTWAPFRYKSPEERRAAVREWVLKQSARGEAPMKIVLVGGPASGKGTIGSMLSQAFRFRVVSAGALLRGEVRAGTRRGKRASARMARGDLLPDSIVLDALNDCLDCWDVQQNGWLLDGFPRTPSQAEAVISDDRWSSLRPDAVVVLHRPDELMQEFILGRMTDTASGQTYHPIYAPPPKEVQHRIVWRVDDVPEVVQKRLEDHKAMMEPILDAFVASGVPVAKFDNARSEIETFLEIAEFIDTERAKKRGSSPAKIEKASEVDLGDDVESICSFEDEQCMVEYTYQQHAEAGENAQLLEAVHRCNRYDIEDYVPVVVGETQVGWASHEMMGHLRGYMTPDYGYMCQFAYPDQLESSKAEARESSLSIELAPLAKTEDERSEVVAELVRALVADGVIARASLRNEIHDVRPFSAGFVGPEGPQPLLRIERAAKIYFGVPSYGVHVNGYVRDPDNPDDPQPHAVWIATRSLSKTTYPGLLDQVVAGGQPSSMTLSENVVRECIEEASLPPAVVTKVRSTGLVSYRYATRKGLSTKRLITYDVEMPNDLSPVCADGEVEEFQLMPVGEMLDSIRFQLPRWKPNSALVAIDFAMRHGLISADEPGFVQLAQMLRTS